MSLRTKLKSLVQQVKTEIHQQSEPAGLLPVPQTVYRPAPVPIFVIENKALVLAEEVKQDALAVVQIKENQLVTLDWILQSCTRLLAFKLSRKHIKLHELYKPGEMSSFGAEVFLGEYRVDVSKLQTFWVYVKLNEQGLVLLEDVQEYRNERDVQNDMKQGLINGELAKTSAEQWLEGILEPYIEHMARVVASDGCKGLVVAPYPVPDGGQGLTYTEGPVSLRLRLVWKDDPANNIHRYRMYIEALYGVIPLGIIFDPKGVLDDPSRLDGLLDGPNPNPTWLLNSDGTEKRKEITGQDIKK